MDLNLLVINRDEAAALLPMHECVALMEDSLAALARGEALVPLRTAMWLPDGTGLLGLMPAHAAANGIMGLKVVSVMPGNHGTEYDAHQGVVLIFETDRGKPLALVDASEITALRTAAVSGVATRYLARDDAGDLAILGTGVQARTHLEAMLRVRTIRRVRVWSRSREHVRDFCIRESHRHGIEVEPTASAEEAVTGADLLCTTTSAREPVLKGEWIQPGSHVNAVGSSVPTARELDSEVLIRSRLFVDSRESALAEAGDLILAEADGLHVPDRIQGELGEVVTGRVPGRTAEDQITLFESLGLGIEDVAAAHFVYERAAAWGLGTRIGLGGRRNWQS